MFRVENYELMFVDDDNIVYNFGMVGDAPIKTDSDGWVVSGAPPITIGKADLLDSKFTEALGDVVSVFNDMASMVGEGYRE